MCCDAFCQSIDPIKNNTFEAMKRLKFIDEDKTAFLIDLQKRYRKVHALVNNLSIEYNEQFIPISQLKELAERTLK